MRLFPRIVTWLVLALALAEIGFLERRPSLDRPASMIELPATGLDCPDCLSLGKSVGDQESAPLPPVAPSVLAAAEGQATAIDDPWQLSLLRPDRVVVLPAVRVPPGADYYGPLARLSSRTDKAFRSDGPKTATHGKVRR